MKKHISIIFAAALTVLPLAAQNISSSVEVSNDFVSDLSGIEKKSVAIEVPDSVTKFDLKFDYDVFSNEYKGAYSFSPYSIRQLPTTESARRPFLYANIGAGYTLHPVLDLIVSPRTKGRFSMNIYQNLSGYVGDYRQIGADLHDVKGSFYKGRDLDELAGIQGTWRFRRSELSVDANYNMLSVQSPSIDGQYHEAAARIRLKSAEWAEDLSAYDLNVLYKFGRETAAGAAEVDQNTLLFFGSFTPVSGMPFKFTMDYNLGYNGHSGALTMARYHISATPRVVFNLGRMNVSAGLQTTYSDSFGLYPDVRIDWRSRNGRFDFIAGAIGGEKINSYSSLKHLIHRFSLANAPDAGGLTFAKEKVNAYAGICGSVSSKLQYEARFSYADVANTPMEALSAGKPVVAFLDFSLFREDATVTWNSKSIQVEGGLHFSQSTLDGIQSFVLPLCRGDISAVYNYRKRLFAGVNAVWCTARANRQDGADLTLPGWADLGLFAEFRTNGCLSFWAKAGNLLNQPVQTGLMQVEKGINITAGICLSLRYN